MSDFHIEFDKRLSLINDVFAGVADERRPANSERERAFSSSNDGALPEISIKFLTYLSPTIKNKPENIWSIGA